MDSPDDLRRKVEKKEKRLAAAASQEGLAGSGSVDSVDSPSGHKHKKHKRDKDKKERKKKKKKRHSSSDDSEDSDEDEGEEEKVEEEKPKKAKKPMNEERRKALADKIMRQAQQYRILAEIRAKELQLEKTKFDSILSRVERKKYDYEKQAFVAMVERYLTILLEEEIKKQWMILKESGEITEDWETLRDKILSEEDIDLEEGNTEASKAWIELRRKALALRKQLAEIKKLFSESYRTTDSAELIQERIAMMLAEMRAGDNSNLTDLRRKNTKKAMISLMATSDDAAVAEIMFDQMTEEEKDKLGHILFDHKQKGVIDEEEEEEEATETEKEKARVLGKLMREMGQFKDGALQSLAGTAVQLRNLLQPKKKSNMTSDMSSQEKLALDGEDDIANYMFGDEGDGMSKNALFERRVAKRAGGDDVSTDSSDEEGGGGSVSHSKKKAAAYYDDSNENVDGNMDDFLGNKSKSSALRNMKHRARDMKDQIARYREKNKDRLQQAAKEKGRPLTDEEIAAMIFEEEEGPARNNPLFERKRVMIKGGDDVSTDSDSDDGGRPSKSTPLSGLSRKKSIRVLEQQLEENLEDFLENKSNTSAFAHVKSKVLDLKDQLAKLKEKEAEKEKSRIKKAADEKGEKLTEEQIAEMMFADEFDESEKFANPLVQRRKSSYRPRKSMDDSDSSDSSDDEPRRPGAARKKTVKRSKSGKEGDDIVAPTAPAEKKKKKGMLSKMLSKKDESDDEWENNLDEFLSKKSRFAALTDMIPTENWGVFKDRIRKLRTVDKKVETHTPKPGTKASDIVDPAKYMFEEDYLDLAPQKVSKLVERRKSTYKRKAESSSDSSDTDSDEDDNPNGVKVGVKLGRAKSIKVGMRPSREMVELEAGMDDFLKNKSHHSKFGSFNNATWEVFKKSVEALRNETESAREAFKERKKRNEYAPEIPMPENKGPGLVEVLEKKKKTKQARFVEGSSSEQIQHRIREIEEELVIEEQLQAALGYAGKASKTGSRRVAHLKANLSGLNMLVQNLSLTDDEIVARTIEVEKQLKSLKKMQVGLQKMVEASHGTQKKETNMMIRTNQEKIDNLEGELRALESRKNKSS